MAAVSIGDPALISGGDAILFYGRIIAGIGASVFGWWYVNYRRKANRGIGSSLPCLLGLGMLTLLTLDFLDADGSGDNISQVAPRVVDSVGSELTTARVGQMVFLWAAYANDREDNQKYVTIIEVRDSKDITVYLQFQTGTLEGYDSGESAISWVPMEHGSHVIRSFQITSFKEPMILSDIQASVFNVIHEDAPDYSKLPKMSMSVHQPANDGGSTISWEGEIGSFCWGNVSMVCGDTAFIVPELLIEINKDSILEFQITNNEQPDELGVIVYKAENILADQQLTTLDSGQYRVDLQSEKEYILFVAANWKDGEYSAGSAVYYYKILVY